MFRLYTYSITGISLILTFLLTNFNTVLIEFSPKQTNVCHFTCKNHHVAWESEALIDREVEKLKEEVKALRESGEYAIRKVVLDAGHGGKDHGCSGANSKEKKITLGIALKLGELLKTVYPDIEIIYTRTKDVFVPLHERATLANEKQADLFISIHCNAMRNASNIRGSETYVMGLHTAEENLEVAKRENSAILLEENYEQNYGGYDPNSPEGHIILSMYQNAFLDQSILLAEQIEEQFRHKAKRKSLGVKQAGFVVLRETAMPSVLIETGYLSNNGDEAFLKTGKGQDLLASSILDAFKDYKYEVESGTGLSKIPDLSTVEIAPKKGYGSAEDIPIASDVIFRVQLAASKIEIVTSAKKWQKLDSFMIVEEEGRYKYLSGSFFSFSEANKARKVLRAAGFKGAFVVCYSNGQRISREKALELLQGSGTR